MKTRNAGLFSGLVLALVVLQESPISAQAEVIVTPKAVTVDATTIAVNATRGSVEIRTLTLRTSESINNLRAISFDSYSVHSGDLSPHSGEPESNCQLSN
jgi:hypothetical protein